MTRTIGQIITELSLFKGGFYEPAVVDSITEMRKIIGAEYDEFVGKFFFGHDNNWEEYSSNDKRDLLIEYVRQELNFVVADLTMD